MGHIKHHAIIVTGIAGQAFTDLHAQAAAIFPSVTPIIASPCNGWRSFLVAPDGSKEDVQDSAEGDQRRAALRRMLSSAPVNWAEVQYGDDGQNSGPARVTHADDLTEMTQPDPAVLA